MARSTRYLVRSQLDQQEDRLRRLGSCILVVGVLFSGLSSVRVAHAQAPSPSAVELAEGARRAYDLGKMDQAVDGYARAYQISGDPNLLYSMAEAHRDAGHDADALRTFQTYLRRDPQGIHRESAEAQVRLLEQKIRRGGSTAPGALAVPPASALSPRSAPAAVAPSRIAPPPLVVVPPPLTPAPVVAPAPRVVAPPAPPPRPALAASPPPPAAIPAAAPGADLTMHAKPPTSDQSPPLPRWVPWATAVTTVALGTSAIIAGTSASSRFDELKNSCGGTAQGCDSAQVSDLHSRARLATILWAATGVAAVGTGISVYVNASAAGMSGLWAF
jgi:hypothetical protein